MPLRLYRPYERRRRVICQRCAQGWLTEFFPHECPFCEASSAWVIGLHIADPAYRTILRNLKRDRRRVGFLP